jgi:hypothetical protein
MHSTHTQSLLDARAFASHKWENPQRDVIDSSGRISEVMNKQPADVLIRRTGDG